ncbi:MAG: xanthine dehydrogenase family protein molybdopterin-binding subunit, partial [Alphaproteobacteria bacterium]
MSGSSEPAPPKFGIGQPATRLEDARLLRGLGRFQDDRRLHGEVHAVLVRSPHAHARIRAIDTAAAAATPGVLAVWTGADYAADGLGMPRATMPRKRADGTPMFAPQRPALALDRVRHVGDPVAMVVAGTLAQVMDAAELVAVDYAALPAVTAVEAAARPDAPRVWDENPDNVSHVFERGDRAATEAAFARAARVVRRRYVVTRVHAQYMEPRGALGVYDPGEARFTLYADVNYPHRVRDMLAKQVFRVPESDVRVIVQDVGGGFGTKGWQNAEHRLVLWAARRLGRPVRWTCTRSEAMLSDEHARDNVADVALALDVDGRFLAVRVDMLANLGAYEPSDRQLL